MHVSERAGGAIGAFVQFALAGAKERRPGRECVLGHFSELMFVDVIRRYLDQGHAPFTFSRTAVAPE